VTESKDASVRVAQRIAAWAFVVSCAYACCLAMAAARAQPNPVAVVGLALTILPVGLLGAIDITVRRLPLAITYGTVAVAAPLLTASPHEASATPLAPAIGMAVMMTIAALIRIVGRGSLGRGDFHFAALTGAVAGWFAPLLAVYAWLATAAVGAVASAAVLYATRNRTSRLPYGPAMIAGLCIALVTRRVG
jgi:prepilin signal peptidase PulO-like enzyme (type II secretory pathway)